MRLVVASGDWVETGDVVAWVTASDRCRFDGEVRGADLPLVQLGQLVCAGAQESMAVRGTVDFIASDALPSGRHRISVSLQAGTPADALLKPGRQSTATIVVGQERFFVLGLQGARRALDRDPETSSP